MAKNKLNDTLKKTLGKIDGAMTALNSYPTLEDAVLNKAQEYANKYLGKLFPTQLDFSKEILEHLVGTDVLINIVSGFLTYALPEVEIALKAALLANMNNLGSGCIIDPIIYEKAIKEGIIFDLRQIDLIDKLSISPLDKKLGQYYYFGIEGCESAYDVLQSAISPMNDSEDKKEKKSYIGAALTNSVGHYFGKRKRDFDCLLWYMKNKAAYREVWGKRTTKSEDIFNYNGGNTEEWLDKKGKKKNLYFEVNDNNNSLFLWSYDSIQNKWTKETGEVDRVDQSKEYTYQDGKTFYTYKYGKPQIKKISRKRGYLDKKVGKVYYYANNDWQNANVTDVKYNSVDEIPTDKTVDVGTTFYIGEILKVVTEQGVTTNSKEKTDKYGQTTQGTFLKGLKMVDVIDITNDISNKTCLFVDYDSDNNKTKIENENYVALTLGFGPTYDEVQKTWNKEVNKTEKVEGVTATTLYYEDNDSYDNTEEKDKAIFDPNSHRILIYPHKKDGKNTKKYRNITNKIKKSKYTKDFGVVTLEYSPRTGNLRQSDGDPLQQQTPYDNVLHVFMGNVKEYPDSQRTAIETDLNTSSNTNKLGKEVCEIMASIKKNHLTLWKKKWKEEKKKYPQTASEYSNCYKFMYNFYEVMLNGNDSTVLTRLTSEYEGFNNITHINKKLDEIKSVFETYFEQKKQATIDEHGWIQKGETNNWIQIGGLSWWNFLYFKDKIKNALTINGKTYSVYAFAKRAAQIMESNENLLYLSAKNLSYPEASKNYYYLHTLFEFNTDYINSLQLFDAKVLAAQIITSLFGGVSLSASAVLGPTASWKTELIRDTVKDMVEKTIAAQDYTVSDCFFTFTNDACNGMLRAAELRQAGLYSNHGEENGNSTIDPISLLEGLNMLDGAADQAEQTTIIEGAIQKVSAEISKDEYKVNSSLSINANFNVQVSFVENLITNLCTQVVMAMLSPKVYLLILINLHMFGLTTNFDIKSFIQKFNGLIMSIVKSCVDKFMEYLSAKIMEIVEELVSKLTIKIQLEQAENYARLLKQIWLHFKQFMNSCGSETVGWTQDVIGNADIIESDYTEATNEC
jgi:uncharacterized protein YozE (UPF0346 family)